MDNNSCLPGDLAIMVLRYLASKGCESAVLSLINDMPFVKYYVPIQKAGETNKDYVKSLAKPSSFHFSLSDLLNDYSKSKTMVTELIEKQDPNGSLAGRCDSLETLLHRLNKMTSSRVKLQITPLEKESFTTETQTIDDLDSIEFGIDEELMDDLPLMFCNSLLNDLSIPQKIANAINQQLADPFARNDNEAVQKVCSQTEPEIDKFMRDLLKDETNCGEQEVENISFDVLQQNGNKMEIGDGVLIIEENCDGHPTTSINVNTSQSSKLQSPKKKTESKNRKKPNASSKSKGVKEPVKDSSPPPPLNNIPKKRIKPIPTPKPTPVFEIQETPFKTLPIGSAFTVSGTVPIPKLSDWEKLGRRSIAPKIINTPLQSSEEINKQVQREKVTLDTPELMSTPHAQKLDNDLIDNASYQTPVEQLSSMHKDLKKANIAEVTPTLEDVGTGTKNEPWQDDTCNKKGGPRVVASAQKFRATGTQSSTARKCFSTPRKRKHVRNLFITTPPSLKSVITSNCLPTIKELDTTLSPQKQKITEPVVKPETIKSTKRVSLRQVVKVDKSKEIPLPLAVPEYRIPKKQKVNDLASRFLVTSMSTEIQETEIDVDVVSGFEDVMPQSANLTTSLKMQENVQIEMNLKKPKQKPSKNVMLGTKTPTPTPTSSSDEDYESKIKKRKLQSSTSLKNVPAAGSNTKVNVAQIVKQNGGTSSVKQIVLSTPRKGSDQDSMRFEYPSDILTIQAIPCPLLFNVTQSTPMKDTRPFNSIPTPNKKQTMATPTPKISPKMPPTPTPRYDLEVDSNSSNSNSLFKIVKAEDSSSNTPFKFGPPPTPGKTINLEDNFIEAYNHSKILYFSKPPEAIDTSGNPQFSLFSIPRAPKSTTDFSVSSLLKTDSLPVSKNTNLNSKSKRINKTASQSLNGATNELYLHDCKYSSLGATELVKETRKCMGSSEEITVLKPSQTESTKEQDSANNSDSLSVEFISLHKKILEKRKRSAPAPTLPTASEASKSLKNVLKNISLNQFLKNVAHKYQQQQP